MTDSAILLTLLGLTIGGVVCTCAYWLWLDAKENAEQRRYEAAMADALTRTVREAKRHQHDDRHTHEREGAPE